ncbi:MAG: phenylalanine--tRNA ligase subunit alpha [bacterium]
METNEIKAQVKKDFENVKNNVELAQVSAKYNGKNGVITGLFSAMRELTDKEQKSKAGKDLNELKTLAEQLYNEKELQLINEQRAKDLSGIDVTLPAYIIAEGHLHPITKTIEEIKAVFMRMGFSVEEGPEIEKDYYNFGALNFPKEHPARDMHDTFHMEDNYLLRTHTSPIQVRVMEKNKPPLKILAPGRVYRRDAMDASHSTVFHQVEGFLVDEGVKFSDLKGTLEVFTREMFGKDLKVRFRPSFFPFTEPSAEVDVQCVNCKGKGCATCKQTGWLEILGCGMIHPNVLKGVNYDSEKYTGFAFGMGVERVAMLKYGIDDMRLFFENDVRFLKQF